MRPDHGFAADSAVPFLRLFLEEEGRVFLSATLSSGRGSQRGDFVIQRSLFFAFVVYMSYRQGENATLLRCVCGSAADLKIDSVGRGFAYARNVP